MQIDAKLKHYKGFYQLFFSKLKTIKTHLRGGRNGPVPSFKKERIVIMLTPIESKTPFLNSLTHS